MAKDDEIAYPTDYDREPERFRAGVTTAERYSLAGDVHEGVAARLSSERLGPVLDLGSGGGRLIAPLRSRRVPVVGFDNSPTMLASLRGPRVRGDAKSLPFGADSFGGVAALYVLYHFVEPRRIIAECRRVLQPGGLFAACAPSRHDHPELVSLLPEDGPMTFDAENGPEMLRESFRDVEVERWDGPFIRLPDQEALALYLYGHGLPKAEAERAAPGVATPLDVTKRGALMFGYKR